MKPIAREQHGCVRIARRDDARKGEIDVAGARWIAQREVGERRLEPQIDARTAGGDLHPTRTVPIQ